MADISSYLAAIMAAVYGEDVRGSIHDAIEIINDVSEVVLNTGTAVTGPTSSSTGFYKDSFYINTSTMELWKCIGTDSWQSQGVLKGADGADGNGIVSIAKTATVGLVDTYTITYDDGGTETYEVTNGQNGSKWYKGTAISGTGTSITGFPGVINDFYLNSADGYVYTCTKTGGAQLPDAAEWDYVMTLTGGGGASITVVDNLASTSSTDALSANQGRVLKGYVDGKQTKYASYGPGLKETFPTPTTLQLSLDLLAGSNITLTPKLTGELEISATGGGGGSSTFAGLTDTDITNPQPDQIVQYKAVDGMMKLQNVNMPQGGHTMIDNATYEEDIIAVANDDTNDEVVSAYGIANWSNCDAVALIAQVNQGDDGVGTWLDDASWESGTKSGWLWSPYLYQVLEKEVNNVTVSVLDKELIPIFDVNNSEAVSLYAYRIDDNYPQIIDGATVNGGCIALKFNGTVKSQTLNVGVKVVHQKTKVLNFTVLS